LLEAKNIHKVYKNGKKELRVLKGIDIQIEKGRFVAIVGPSGAGKSTLLHILGGLDKPTEGRVFLEEQDIYELSDSAISEMRNKRIGFVFQFYHLLSEFTVLENVWMPSLIFRTTNHEQRKTKAEALTLLGEVGLTERAQHFPNQLSGGEAQRTAIARGLINEPDVLLCDEPTGNLDSATGNDIISLIKKINLERQMTVIMVTHNVELAKSADKVFHLRDGILVR
jgi:lipoprotein-releasing system ATP-binding protein